MMVSGAIGAVLFAIPGIDAKVAGVLFIHLWYVLDCSDGETARIEKRFSRFGKEIDYVAHVVNHPLFNLAFALVGMERHNSLFILFASITCISAELVLRNLVSFRFMYELKMKSPITKRDRGGVLKKTFVQIVCFFSVYPNFALLFPLAYGADLYFGSSIAVYYLFAQTLVTSLLAIWRSINWVRTIVRVV
jgi:phosphatidylserine synthase